MDCAGDSCDDDDDEAEVIEEGAVDAFERREYHCLKEMTASFPPEMMALETTDMHRSMIAAKSIASLSLSSRSIARSIWPVNHMVPRIKAAPTPREY